MHRLVLAITGLLVLISSQGFAQSSITNGGFEASDLSGWNSSGNGSIQVLHDGQLGPVGSAEGMYFALVGNGPGDVENDGLPDMGILTSNPFSVSSTGILRYSFDFLTAEFTGSDADPSHLDAFSITLQQQGAAPTLLIAGDVSQASFTPIDGGNVVVAPDGTSVIDHLGWRMGSVFLLPGTYSLQFLVTDAGDGSFDSALLADGVEFVPTSDVPEVGGSAYFAATGLALLAARRFHGLRRARLAKRAKMRS